MYVPPLEPRVREGPVFPLPGGGLGVGAQWRLRGWVSLLVMNLSVPSATGCLCVCFEDMSVKILGPVFN